jgi:cytochrome c-type biogenesis protein CcmH
MSMLYRVFLLGLLFIASPVFSAQQPKNLEEQTRAIASELRCVVCQNLSVADSPSEMAKEMRAIVHEQLQAGKSPEEIKSYFVSKYGEWVLLSPEKKGFSLLVWVLPFAVLVAGLVLGVWVIRRWTRRKSQRADVRVDPKISAWLRKEMMTPDLPEPDPEDTSPRAELLRDGMRFLTEIKELEFDFQAGKLGEADYTALRQEVEGKAAHVLQQLDALPAKRPTKTVAKKTGPTDAGKKAAENRRSVRQWQLVTGGVFLLVFGIAVGVFLTQSVRPRGSAGDSMTGGFLTGTSGENSDVPSLLKEGEAAFEKQNWSRAIQLFKKVLAVEPDNPQAHTYMAYILVQAGHTDGALEAFDKALSVAPNFQLALWGKGMALYRSKQDYAAARQVFQKLLKIMPAGQGRAEVEKVLAEIPRSNKAPLPASTAAAGESASSPSSEISGQISIDPKIKNKVDSQATLFIIAHSPGTTGGPPVAVKKIDRPTFPLSYSLGSENSMMQGSPFPGKVAISVRLDKDGNAMTHGPGDLLGEYKQNPVATGSKNVNIVIDQMAK